MNPESGRNPADRTRRFGGVERLYGVAALETFRAAHVAVIGLGGVGSWAAEALARSGIGRLTLIDLDMIAESNLNRQIHALEGNFGKAKVEAMKERIAAIDPECAVTTVEDFITVENAAEFCGKGYDFIIDAIDQRRPKTALLAWCRRHRIPVVTTGAAGGKSDPRRIVVDDLARTVADPLLSKVRAQLRREFGFPRAADKKFGISAVFSTEAVRAPEIQEKSCHAIDDIMTESKKGPAELHGLNCGGFGSSVCVTGSFGFFAAAAVLEYLGKPSGEKPAEKNKDFHDAT
ncbi:MAG: tRNA threonylcarbamoyladenosine dehydratase [Betaproteobacteria bacterium]|nr:tRNA threonylcarbamoyladenosine dehydratase [Betaproteobacteria bacterium]